MLMAAGTVAMVLAGLPAGPAWSVVNGIDSGAPQEQRVAESLVRDVQEQLRRMGLYNGPVDGVLGPLTSHAIKEIQQANGWPVDGQPNQQLLEHLRSQQDKAQALLDHIEVNRIDQINDARETLVSSEVTSDLLDPVIGGLFLDTDAQAACADQPTPTCLLEHAIAAAREMNDVEQRSFALLRIAEIQVRLGQVEAARQTLRRIRDPRCILNALDVLAIGLSNDGRYDEALALMDVVPIPRVKLAGLDAIARAAHEAGETAIVDQTIARARVAASSDDSDAANAWRLVELARLLTAVARPAEALDVLDDAAQLNIGISDDETRDRIAPEIVQQLLLLDRFDTARALTDTIVTPRHKALAQLALVRYQVDRGQYDNARQIADGIELAEYRSLALAASAGDPNDTTAQAILVEALDAAREIPFKRRRDEALAVIAQGQAAAGDPDAALQTSGLIGDTSLRARTLFAMAGDNTPLAIAARQALDAVDQAYYRSLLQIHLAVELAANGDRDAAGRTLDDAIINAFAVQSDAYRALALAQSAQSAEAAARLIGR